MSSVVDKLLGMVASKEQTQATADDAEWRQLVIQCVDSPSKGPRAADPEAVAIQLTRLGKSLADLEAATTRYAERKALVQAIADGLEATPKIQALRAARLKKEEEARAQDKANQEAIKELYSQELGLEKVVRDGNAARPRLLNSSNPSTFREYTANEEQLQAVREQIRLCDIDLSSSRSAVEFAGREAKAKSRELYSNEKAVIERMEVTITAHQAERDAKESELNVLLERRSKLLAGDVVNAQNF